MLTAALAAPTVIAYHETGGGGASPLWLLAFLGVAATAGWLIFSKLSWNATVAITVVAWALGLTLAFVF